MNLSCLLPLLEALPSYRELVRQAGVQREGKVVVLDAAKPYVIAALHGELDLPIMVITVQPGDTRKLYEQLQVWCSHSANLHYFPEVDFHLYEPVASYYSSTMVQRLQT